MGSNVVGGARGSTCLVTTGSRHSPAVLAEGWMGGCSDLRVSSSEVRPEVILAVEVEVFVDKRVTVVCVACCSTASIKASAISPLSPTFAMSIAVTPFCRYIHDKISSQHTQNTKSHHKCMCLH